MPSVSLLVFGAVLLFLPKSQGCSPAEGWHTMTFPQRIVKADIVAYVKVLNKTETPVDIDEEYILLLTRREDGVLTPDEVNIESAALPATQDNLDMVARTCGLPDFTLPLGDANNQTGCPTHPNDSGEQCVYAGAASHVVMSTTLSLMCALLTYTFGLLWAAM
uniref:Generative cell specific-1/HAP2 domain-containing protein n=1 Tax=Branchiostoma floridae TaxID=7739 RepID=C3ZHL6_BRAFL|eukprot:XP_002592000.1 hypothetical protein BRAFLDRAFT_79589 [Branchiostoma floridae]